MRRTIQRLGDAIRKRGADVPARRPRERLVAYQRRLQGVLYRLAHTKEGKRMSNEDARLTVMEEALKAQQYKQERDEARARVKELEEAAAKAAPKPTDANPILGTKAEDVDSILDGTRTIGG